MSKQAEPINRIKRRFNREWLLISVDEIDEFTTTPLTGRLIAHSKNRDEIYKKSIDYKEHILIMCSADTYRKRYGATL